MSLSVDHWLIEHYFWGRPVLTGCVKSYASMQAHEGRALITALNNLRGETTYAMAA